MIDRDHRIGISEGGAGDEIGSVEAGGGEGLAVGGSLKDAPEIVAEFAIELRTAASAASVEAPTFREAARDVLDVASRAGCVFEEKSVLRGRRKRRRDRRLCEALSAGG